MTFCQQVQENQSINCTHVEKYLIDGFFNEIFSEKSNRNSLRIFIDQTNVFQKIIHLSLDVPLTTSRQNEERLLLLLSNTYEHHSW